MDTISRENNSVLPMAGVIVGVIALVVGVYAAIAENRLKNHLTEDYDPKIARIDDIASQASSAQASATSANDKIADVVKQTQEAFNGVGTTLGTIQTQLAKLEEGTKRSVHGRAGSGPVVAGPGEYIVKGGDSGARIARSNGVTLRDLMAVNPDVNWKRLHPGQKIKLPESKGAEAAPAPAPAPAQ